VQDWLRPTDFAAKNADSAEFFVSVGRRAGQHQFAGVVEQDELAVGDDDAGVADARAGGRWPIRFTRDGLACRIFDADFAILCPIVGTPLFDDLKQQGRLTSENWDHYAWYHVNYKPLLMTAQQLQDGILWLFQEYNSPPRVYQRIEYFRRVFERLHAPDNGLRAKLETLGLTHYLQGSGVV